MKVIANHPVGFTAWFTAQSDAGSATATVRMAQKFTFGGDRSLVMCTPAPSSRFLCENRSL